MKKTIVSIGLAFIIGTLAVSCGSSNSTDSDGSEETKMISKKQVKMSGEYRDDIEVVDSVKLLLVNIEEDKWQIKSIIPIEAGLGVGKENIEKGPWAKVRLLDANGLELDYSQYINEDDLKSAYSSSDRVDATTKAGFIGDKTSYEKLKKLFDKASCIKIEPGYSYTSVDSDIPTDDINDAFDEAEREYDKAKDKASKEFSKAMKEAQDAMDGLY